MSKETKIPEFIAIVQELQKRRENESLESKFGWYMRHRSKAPAAELTKSDSTEKKDPEPIDDFDFSLLG